MSALPPPYTVHHVEKVLDDWFDVDAATVSFQAPDGRMVGPKRVLCMERGESVAALVHDPNRDLFVFVKQFRYPSLAHSNGWLVELVAGGIDGGESPEAAVHREMIEEVGLAPTGLTRISEFFVSPGGTSEYTYLYYAQVDLDRPAGEGGGMIHEDEHIEVLTWSRADMAAALSDGTFKEARLILAATWALQGGASPSDGRAET